MSHNYRIDPVTGAVLFPKSAGKQKFQQMERKIEEMNTKISYLECKIESLEKEVLELKKLIESR